jgi:hypothetical protein
MSSFERISRAAYLLIVVLGAISVSALAFVLTAQGNRLDDQADQQQQQLRLIETALLAECHTRAIIQALAEQTIRLLRTQTQTPATQHTILVFGRYVRVLSQTGSCDRLEQAVRDSG